MSEFDEIWAEIIPKAVGRLVAYRGDEQRAHVALNIIYCAAATLEAINVRAEHWPATLDVISLSDFIDACALKVGE